MKALIKYSLLTLLLLILLLVVAAVIIPMLVNPNDYKPQLEELVHEHSGMEMSIQGDIKLSVFPWLGFEVAGISLNNQQQPLAELTSARAGLKLLPLLSGTVEMQALELNGLDLRLHKDANGKANWELPNAASAESADSSATNTGNSETAAGIETTANAIEEPTPAIDFNIAKINIRDISVHYRDEQQGTRYQLDNMHLTTGAIEPGQPFDLQLEFVASGSAPQATVNANLTTRVSFDLQQQQYQLEKLNLATDIMGEATAGKAVSLNLQANLNADLAKDQLSLTNLTLQLANLTINADIQIDSLKQPSYHGKVQIPAFDLNALLSAMGQPPVVTSHPDALSSISFSSQLKGTDQQISLDQLSIGLDNSRLNGQLKIVDFARQALRFNLSGDRLNVDDYLPPKQETSKDSSKTTGANTKSSTSSDKQPWDDSPLLPVEALKSLDVIGQLQLQELIVSKVSITDSTVKLSAQKGVLKLKQLSGKVFDGDFMKTAIINLNKNPIAISANVILSKVDIRKVLTIATPEQPAARGRANINSTISARGNSLKKIINSLNGNTGFSIEEGALLGTNLNHMVCSSVAKVRKKSLTGTPQTQDTPFHHLAGNFTIRNGIATNKDLKATMDNLKLTGDGEINLPRKHLDYHLGLTIVGNSEDQDEACQINEKYADIAWPVRCKGEFEGNKDLCGIDNERMGAIITRLAGKEVEQKISEKIEEKLGTSLKGLFDKFK